MDEDKKPMMAKCGVCNGEGVVALGGVYEEAWNVLAKHGESYALVVARIAGARSSAMRNRLKLLEKHGFVKSRYPEGDRREKLYRIALVKERPKVKNLILYSNGLFAACDEHGQQIPELQSKSVIELWCEFAALAGFDTDGCVVKMQSPGGPGVEGVIRSDFDGVKLEVN